MIAAGRLIEQKNTGVLVQCKALKDPGGLWFTLCKKCAGNGLVLGFSWALGPDAERAK